MASVKAGVLHGCRGGIEIAKGVFAFHWQPTVRHHATGNRVGWNHKAVTVPGAESALSGIERDRGQKISAPMW